MALPFLGRVQDNASHVQRQEIREIENRFLSYHAAPHEASDIQTYFFREITIHCLSLCASSFSQLLFVYPPFCFICILSFFKGMNVRLLFHHYLSICCLFNFVKLLFGKPNFVNKYLFTSTDKKLILSVCDDIFYSAVS